MISVYFVDDHAMIRLGFRLLLEAEDDIRVIGEANCGEEAYPECLQLNPDVIVADISMPGEGGLAFTRRLLRKNPQARVLMVSMHDDEAFISHAIQLGASGYISKSGNPSDLAPAIRKVASGLKWIAPEVALQLVFHASAGQESPVEVLTTREFEIFIMLSEGKSTNEVAGILHISPKTANVHRANILEKLKVKNAVQLSHIAVKMGVLNMSGLTGK